ncbi:hypothetical protein KIPB_004972, partial [Kipferlia bialata]|eukprot:g4972.t1
MSHQHISWIDRLFNTQSPGGAQKGTAFMDGETEGNLQSGDVFTALVDHPWDVISARFDKAHIQTPSHIINSTSGPALSPPERGLSTISRATSIARASQFIDREAVQKTHDRKESFQTVRNATSSPWIQESRHPTDSDPDGSEESDSMNSTPNDDNDSSLPCTPEPSAASPITTPRLTPLTSPRLTPLAGTPVSTPEEDLPHLPDPSPLVPSSGSLTFHTPLSQEQSPLYHVDKAYVAPQPQREKDCEGLDPPNESEAPGRRLTYDVAAFAAALSAEMDVNEALCIVNRSHSCPDNKKEGSYPGVGGMGGVMYHGNSMAAISQSRYVGNIAIVPRNSSFGPGTLGGTDYHAMLDGGQSSEEYSYTSETSDRELTFQRLKSADQMPSSLFPVARHEYTHPPTIDMTGSEAYGWQPGFYTYQDSTDVYSSTTISASHSAYLGMISQSSGSALGLYGQYYSDTDTETGTNSRPALVAMRCLDTVYPFTFSLNTPTPRKANAHRILSPVASVGDIDIDVTEEGTVAPPRLPLGSLKHISMASLVPVRYVVCASLYRPSLHRCLTHRTKSTPGGPGGSINTDGLRLGDHAAPGAPSPPRGCDSEGEGGSGQRDCPSPRTALGSGADGDTPVRHDPETTTTEPTKARRRRRRRKDGQTRELSVIPGPQGSVSKEAGDVAQSVASVDAVLLADLRALHALAPEGSPLHRMGEQFRMTVDGGDVHSHRPKGSVSSARNLFLAIWQIVQLVYNKEFRSNLFVSFGNMNKMERHHSLVVVLGVAQVAVTCVAMHFLGVYLASIRADPVFAPIFDHPVLVQALVAVPGCILILVIEIGKLGTYVSWLMALPHHLITVVSGLFILVIGKVVAHGYDNGMTHDDMAVFMELAWGSGLLQLLENSVSLFGLPSYIAMHNFILATACYLPPAVYMVVVAKEGGFMLVATFLVLIFSLLLSGKQCVTLFLATKFAVETIAANVLVSRVASGRFFN